MNTYGNKSPEKSYQSAASSLVSKGSAFSLQDNRPRSVVQKKANNTGLPDQLKSGTESLSGHSIQLQDNRPQSVVQRKKNNTGLPDQLKSGIESLSGHLMDDVKVHYNSDKPAQLSAHAYAQGTDIHLASGQEKHLPHEAWHVVQQKQGRVKPTMQMKGKVNVNDDKGLEKEADVMGVKALQFKEGISPSPQKKTAQVGNKITGQLMLEEGVSYADKLKLGLPHNPHVNVLQPPGREAETEYKSMEEEKSDLPENGRRKEGAKKGSLTNKSNVQHFLDELEANPGDYLQKLEHQHKKSKKQKARKNQKKKPERNKIAKLQDEFAGMSGKESAEGLNPIDVLQESIFSNLLQGGSNLDWQKVKGRKHLKKVKKHLEDQKTQGRNYKIQLEKTRAAILQGGALVRKMSKAERQSYIKWGGDRTKVFPAGSEGMKAFRIDATYVFSDSARNNKKEDYEMLMMIRLSSKLKTYFINFLSPNVANPLGVKEKNLQFGSNPQFKFENDDCTILIPPSGWANFWSFVNNDFTFKIVK
jgi:hypothetical protein